MSRKIIAITLNSAVDKIIRIEKIKSRHVIESDEHFAFPSGKAMNSAKTLESLETKVTGICFVGENDYNFFSQLNSSHIKLKLFKVFGNTRNNITLIDRNHSLIAHLKTSGYTLSEIDLEYLYAALNKIVKSNDIIILSGSLPRGVPVNSYRTLIEYFNKKGSKVVFDSSKLFLKEGIKAKPYLAKPNIKELADITNGTFSREKDIVNAAKAINRMGIEFVFVSRGAKGVIVTQNNRSGYWIGGLKSRLDNIQGNEIGCGDAMVGGISFGLYHNYDTENLINIAVATGTANLLKMGPGLCNAQDVKHLQERISIQFKQ
jgi:1-phosphofructokinase family hexose kinase